MYGYRTGLSGSPHFSLYILEILNGCILFIVIIIIIGLFNTKREVFVKLGELFLTIINLGVVLILNNNCNDLHPLPLG